MANKPSASKTTARTPEQMIPQSAEEYTQRGWLYYSSQEYAKAEEDFRQAIQLCPDDLDIYYALGLDLKFLGRTQDSVKTFELVNSLTDRLDDRVRALMIRRLSHGHINQMTQGNWNLAKDVWKQQE